MSTDRVELDFEANEGIAEGAVLRFLGVPILAVPVLTFPLTTSARPAGCRRRSTSTTRAASSSRCPGTGTSRRSATRRSRRWCTRAAASAWTSEFRYLEPRHQGEVQWHWLPYDRVAGESRNALQWKQQGLAFGGDAATRPALEPRGPARLRRQLLEGLPARAALDHAAPAAAVRRGRTRQPRWARSTPRPMRARSTGRCCRTPTRRR